MSPKTDHPRFVLGILFLIAFWLAVRIAFFQGFQGSDDFHHLRYAWFWDRPPADHWEARLPYNALLFVCLRVLGYSQVSAAVPGMVGSLLIMGSAVWLAWQGWHSRAMCGCVGLLLASLPMDVLACTTPYATKILATGFLAAGTSMLDCGRNRGSAYLGGSLFALAVFTHLAVVFSVPIWIGTLAWMLPEQRRRCLIALLTTGVVSVALNAGIYGLWTGDPLHQFRLAITTHLNHLNDDPEARHVVTAAGQIDPEFIIRPIRDLLLSKALGLLGAVAVIGALATWRRRTLWCRMFVVAALLTWLWMSYGTHSPSNYVPFPGTTAYWQPLGLLLALIVAELLLSLRRTAPLAGAMGIIVAVNLALPALSGSWGQNVRISSELLAYVHQHPQTLFVTDDRTLTDFALLERFVLPSNVRGVPNSKGPKFVTTPRFSGDTDHEPPPVILMNTLNDRPDNSSFAWLRRHSGKQILAGEVKYRPLTCLLPAGYRNTHPWTVRKVAPAAFLFAPAAGSIVKDGHP